MDSIGTPGGDEDGMGPMVPPSWSRGRDANLSDVNTRPLSGLLNVLDGEGRIVFATTNHLGHLDPGLSHLVCMDVWVEVPKRKQVAGGGALAQLLLVDGGICDEGRGDGE